MGACDVAQLPGAPPRLRLASITPSRPSSPDASSVMGAGSGTMPTDAEMDVVPSAEVTTGGVKVSKMTSVYVSGDGGELTGIVMSEM